MILSVIYRKLVNDKCDVKKAFICMTRSLETAHQQECPDGFIAYKSDCFYHSQLKADYKDGQVQCALRGSRIVAIKDRAVYDFIRAWAITNKFGDFYLGFNFTTNSTEITATYSDGKPFNKSIDYDFDDERDKFGHKECSYLKKGISYKPRDISCSELLEQVCQWNSKYKNII